MKVTIGRDELYPVYDLDAGYGKEVNIRADKLKRWRKIEKDFFAMQDKLETLYDEAETRRLTNK